MSRNQDIPISEFPVRINKYLALKKYASRRDADRLIQAGSVEINGRRAAVGDKVSAADIVSVQGQPLTEFQRERVYLAFNKPAGIITHSPTHRQRSIADILTYPVPVYPLGRLDMDSRGLILLTNDGRVTGRLLDPTAGHEKEYEVEIDRRITRSFLQQMEAGVDIGGYVTKKCRTKKIDAESFSIVLTEGKKRQIRRMCGALGCGVRDLRRIRIMNIELGELREGSYRLVQGAELSKFLGDLGLN